MSGKNREKSGLEILTNYINDDSSLNKILEEKEKEKEKGTEDKAYKEGLDNLLTNIFTIRKIIDIIIKKIYLKKNNGSGESSILNIIQEFGNIITDISNNTLTTELKKSNVNNTLPLRQRSQTANPIIKRSNLGGKPKPKSKPKSKPKTK